MRPLVTVSARTVRSLIFEYHTPGEARYCWAAALHAVFCSVLWRFSSSLNEGSTYCQVQPRQSVGSAATRAHVRLVSLSQSRNIRRVKYLKRVWPYFRPYTGLAVFAAVVIVLSAGVAVGLYWPVVILIDQVLGDKPAPWFARWVFRGAAGDKGRLVWFV